MKLNDIKGIKSARLKLLSSLEINNLYDLINYFPSKYYDVSEESSFLERTSPKLLKCRAESVSAFKGTVKAKLICKNNKAEAVWFNQPYVKNTLQTDKEYYFFGKCSFGKKLTFINPIFESVCDVKKLKGIMPVYPLCEGLGQGVFIAALKDVFERVSVKSLIPENLIKKYELCDLKQAYCGIHFPHSLNDIASCTNRIAIEQLFCRFLSFYIYSGNSKVLRTKKYKGEEEIIKPFTDSLGYELTKSQQRCISEIISDLRAETLMNRLLEGDVGSGKTAAAFAAMYYVAKSGGQCAMMAPTEILARQHYNNALKLFTPFGIRVGYLSASLSAEEKKTALFNIKYGGCDIIIGTHSLISDDVKFFDLRLAVCDEQHRFGVKQRSALRNKGAETDMLIMSATPMPRTLTLAMFGELSVSLLDEKPHCRIPVQTNIVPQNKIEDMFSFIRERIGEGRQAYIVSRGIDADSFENESAVRLHAELSNGALKGIETGLLHGNLSQTEKDTVMADLISGKIKALVSTSIIEVGIDVPNSSVIVIYEADKFGLSQLHQLRGRVGRSTHKSYCFLLCGEVSQNGAERLLAVKNCDNGFELAEKDLQMRGAGEFIGIKQHGSISEINNINITEEILKKSLAIYKESVADSNFTSKIKEKYNNTENETDNYYSSVVMN